MRITLLGHAALLVELAGATCLMDPVFFDPFEEGAVVSCPRRTTHHECSAMSAAVVPCLSDA
jgi:L-ascorbate metabolism protein UlaG (beta-lactamase superfamily)